MTANNEQYKYLWGEGKVKVGVITTLKRGTWGSNGESGQLTLEGTLFGENEDTLLFEQLWTSTAAAKKKNYKTDNEGKEIKDNWTWDFQSGTTLSFSSSKGELNKSVIGAIYLLEEKG